MLAPNHSVFGLFLTLTTLAVFGIKISLHWTILLFSIIGSLFPDIDVSRSLIGRLLPFLSKPIEQRFNHRTVTHSLLAWLATTVSLSIILLTLYLIPQTKPYIPTDLAIRWIAAFSIGYMSHLILDMFNKRGVQLFWPQQTRDVITKNPNMRLEVGTKLEIPIFIVFFIFMILSLPLSKYGLSSSLRWLLATPSSTIEEYRNLETKLFIEFTGIFNTTRDPITGSAQILTIQNKRLVVLMPPKETDITENTGRLYTLSDTLAADIIAKNVRFQKTKLPIKVETKSFEKKTKEYLLKAVPENTLISGTIQLPKDLEVYFPASLFNSTSSIKPIEQKKDQLILTFATKQQLSALALNESFELQMRKDQTILKRINLQIKNVKKNIIALKNIPIEDDGLTPLGRKLLGDTRKKINTEDKEARLKQKLAELQIEKEEHLLDMKSRELIFSGEVNIRH